MKAANGSLNAKPGDAVKFNAVTLALRGKTNAVDALGLAQARGWLKPLGSDYLELTRKGYLAVRLNPERPVSF